MNLRGNFMLHLKAHLRFHVAQKGEENDAFDVGVDDRFGNAIKGAPKGTPKGEPIDALSDLQKDAQ